MSDWRKTAVLVAIGVAATSQFTAPARADDDDFRIRSHVDEDIQYRDHVGLSKLRTMGQTDLDQVYHPSNSIFSEFKLHGTGRVSYDATYEVNDTHFGDKAGGPVIFTQSAIDGPPAARGASEAFGGGIGLFNSAGVGGPNNPNQGLEKLSGFYGADNGADWAVPVRPCDVDHRGCIKGYMDANKQELESPEFDKRLDFLREMYADGEIPVGNDTLALRLGRQQVVWGRTDLFRVLDVVNPVDYSRNNIYDELQDSRIPMGMLRADYRMGARGPFDDLNAQGLWVMENFRPNDLGQGGSTNTPLNAAPFFRAMKNCWDNGCTVNNFGAAGHQAVTFGPNEIGIRQADIPHGLSHSTVGGKIEGELDGVGFSLNALSTYSQMPSMHGGQRAVDPFSGASGNYPYVFAFDLAFPHEMVYGGSLDFNLDKIDTTIRFETAYTEGEEHADTASPDLYKKADTLRYVIGADRNTFIPFLNPKRAFLISGQLFGTHLMTYDQQTDPTSGGHYGMADFQDNWVASLLVKGWYQSDTISPQVKVAHDFKARASVIEPALEYSPSGTWMYKLGVNVKFGEDKLAWDDGTSNPIYPETPASRTGANTGAFPLGIFRSGVLGMAHDETQAFASASLRF